MIFFQFLLFMPVLVFAVNHHINNGLLVRREDTYDFTGDDVFSGADYMNADPLDNADPNDPDYTLFLDDTPNQDDFNLVSSDCSSQPTGKLRSREQCDNPSAPKLEIPPLDTIDSAAIELKQRCEDTEKRLCCAGDEINFWNGFRSIVLNCAECQLLLKFLSPSISIKAIWFDQEP